MRVRVRHGIEIFEAVFFCQEFLQNRKLWPEWFVQLWEDQVLVPLSNGTASDDALCRIQNPSLGSGVIHKGDYLVKGNREHLLLVVPFEHFDSYFEEVT